MDREIETLLKIVKERNPSTSLMDIDIPRLVRLSFRHKVIYPLLLFAQNHRDAFSDEQISKLTGHNLQVARKSLTQLHEIKKIADLLNSQGIPYVCIKGPQLSRMIYGREASKESVDIDIMLVNAGDLLKVHENLNNLGYSQSNLNDYPGRWRRKIFLVAKREVHYFNRQNHCAIDLHIRPGANTYLTEHRFQGFLEDLTYYDLEGTKIPVLKDEAYLVYLCYHGALHQFSRLAWLLDIRAFLILKQKELNFGKLFSIARERKIERCVYLALRLIQDYFDEVYTDQLPPEAYSRRIKTLADRCKVLLIREVSYGMSIKGRAGKVAFIMMLLKGLPPKIDWLYGIFMRQLIKLL